MSEKTTIFESLIKFQSKIQAVSKSANNPFYKSKYATLDSIQKAIQPILTDCGLCYTQTIAENGLITTLYNAQGEKLESGAIPLVLTGKPQDRGSEITYARRYSLTSFLGLIVEDEDDDGNKANEQPVKQEWNATNTIWMTEKQLNQLKELIEKKENLEGVNATVQKYSGQVIDGVKYMMKKAYLTELQNLMNK